MAVWIEVRECFDYHANYTMLHGCFGMTEGAMPSLGRILVRSLLLIK
jgi:hypothetical protein